MVAKFVGSDLGNRALKTIAQIQADQGDLPGALETSPTSGDSNDVLLVFARRQIANADLDGALKTAERMDSKAAGQVFYEVGDALRQRGEQNRLRELASHMSSPEMAALFRKLARFTLWYRGEIRTIQPDPCSPAYHDATIGEFAAADAVIEQNQLFVYILHCCSAICHRSRWRRAIVARARRPAGSGRRVGSVRHSRCQARQYLGSSTLPR